MFAVISTRLPGNFQRCRKSYCRQPQTIIWKFAAVARIRFRNGSVRRYAITNAINERWKTLVISFNRRPFLVSMSMLAAPVAMTPFICCTACHGLCRTLSPFPPRRHICKERIRVLPPHDRIFFPPFPIMARCRGSVTGNNLKPCFAA